MSEAKTIRKYLKSLETEASILNELRAQAKTESGRMNGFGRDLLAAAKNSGVKQAFVARLLQITPGAVSQHYSR